MTIAETYGSEITINDALSTALSLTIAPARLREDSGTRWVRFGASLNGSARFSDTPVDVRVTGGTAVEGTDYSVFGTYFRDDSCWGDEY